MEKINVTPLVLDKLKELSKQLYEKEYFGFIEDAENYVQNLRVFIFSIPNLQRKSTTNNKYGSYYCKYKHNHKTTWYITFDIEDDCYLIKNITNNHSADYPNFVTNM
jgi:hypothetical protein